MKASEMQVDRNISLLFKGPNGLGKTIAACSFAVAGPVWLAYFDKRQPIELLTFFKKHRPELLKNIDVDVYSAHNPHEYLNKLIKMQKDNYCPYIAGVTDSVTKLTTAAVGWSMAFRANKGRGRRDSEIVEAPQVIPDFDEYKVETGLATQALDIASNLPWFNIWIAHPLPRIEISATSAGKVGSVSKSTTIVSYGQKVGALVPAGFTEIYHFARSMEWDANGGKAKYLVFTDAIGDDYAKTAFDLPTQFDITDKLFYEVWQPLASAAIAKLEKKEKEQDDLEQHIITKPDTTWKPNW